MKKGKSIVGSMLLFLTACIWGLAFVSQSKGMEVMGPLTFNGVRSLLGAAVVLPIALVRTRGLKVERTERADEDNLKAGKVCGWKLTLFGGLLCGLLFTAASTLQQYGIAITSVGKAGFITTLYIIFVPLFGLFFGRKVPAKVWVGAGIAAVGMYLLCVTEEFSLTMGDMLVFVCAVLFAIHILVIDHFTAEVEGVWLSCIQLFVCGVICTGLALFLEKPSFVQLSQGAVPILYAGVLSCGVAYTLQIVGQKSVNPSIASLILSLESVVATLAGVAAYRIGFLKTNQELTLQQAIGCAVVFGAVILVQLPLEKKNKNKK